MTLAERNDPLFNFKFQVEISGLIRAGFSEVSGIEAEVETEEYKEGGVNGYIHKLPKIAKYPNLVLKRGITDSGFLWNWHLGVVNGIITRLPVRIILQDYQGNEKWFWICLDAYPVKWVGPSFKADDNSTAIETLELVHTGLLSAEL